jgi:hypothetical protein
MTRFAFALIAVGVLVLVLGGYLSVESRVICEYNPDCLPGWWVPSLLAIAAVLIGAGVALAWRRRGSLAADRY